MYAYVCMNIYYSLCVPLSPSLQAVPEVLPDGGRPRLHAALGEQRRRPRLPAGAAGGQRLVGPRRRQDGGEEAG